MLLVFKTKMRILIFYFLVFFINYHSILCLNNGLAKTPPMGWLSWERFQCNIRCDRDPDNCISEKLFKEMANRLVEDGYRNVGYEYINIDDCWMAPQRDEEGNMVADPNRFPHGIDYLSEYMHSMGLKLGIYQDFGIRTCMGYPGLVGHMEQDARKFAEWKVDMVKVDGCHSKVEDLDDGYIQMGKYLKDTGRDLLYSCSWPFYKLLEEIEPNYKLISSHCNMWRIFLDIHDSWGSIEKIIDFFGDNQEVLALHTGPGAWSDPDMLMIGNHHLSAGQSRAQMAVWSMIPGPLLMSNDLRSIKPFAKKILLNKRVIAVNQDKLGIPGKRIYKKNNVEIWKRKVLPISRNQTSYALLFLNRQHAKKASFKIILKNLELTNPMGYFITDLFNNKSIGVAKPFVPVMFSVYPMDVVMLHCLTI